MVEAPERRGARRPRDDLGIDPRIVRATLYALWSDACNVSRPAAPAPRSRALSRPRTHPRNASSGRPSRRRRPRDRAARRPSRWSRPPGGAPATVRGATERRGARRRVADPRERAEHATAEHAGRRAAAESCEHAGHATAEPDEHAGHVAAPEHAARDRARAQPDEHAATEPGQHAVAEPGEHVAADPDEHTDSAPGHQPADDRQRVADLGTHWLAHRDPRRGGRAPQGLDGAGDGGPAAISARAAMIDKRVDHYALLEVAETATPAQIRKTYFALARQLHPDRLASLGIADDGHVAHKVFAQLNTAFSVLSDPQRRADYDDLLGRGGEEALSADGSAPRRSRCASCSRRRPTSAPRSRSSATTSRPRSPRSSGDRAEPQRARLRGAARVGAVLRRAGQERGRP